MLFLEGRNLYGLIENSLNCTLRTSTNDYW